MVNFDSRVQIICQDGKIKEILFIFTWHQRDVTDGISIGVFSSSVHILEFLFCWKFEKFYFYFFIFVKKDFEINIWFWFFLYGTDDKRTGYDWSGWSRETKGDLLWQELQSPSHVYVWVWSILPSRSPNILKLYLDSTQNRFCTSYIV